MGMSAHAVKSKHGNARNADKRAMLGACTKSKTAHTLPTIDVPLTGVDSCDIPHLIAGWDREALELYFCEEHDIDVSAANDIRYAPRRHTGGHNGLSAH